MERRKTGHRRMFPAEVRKGCSELDGGGKESSRHGCSTVNEAKSGVRKSQSWAEARSQRIFYRL